MRHATWMEEDERDGRRYQTMYGGIAIYLDRSLDPGTVEFRNKDGEVIGRIVGVKQIDVRG